MILDYPAYMRSCYEHLMSEKVLDDGATKKYFSKVEELDLERTKTKIRKVVQEVIDDEILSKEEFNAMLADDKDAAKFYCTFKVHKRHEPMTAPPTRPIVS